jgi:hypothetical protein
MRLRCGAVPRRRAQGAWPAAATCLQPTRAAGFPSTSCPDPHARPGSAADRAAAGDARIVMRASARPSAGPAGGARDVLPQRAALRTATGARRRRL